MKVEIQKETESKLVVYRDWCEKNRGVISWTDMGFLFFCGEDDEIVVSKL